MFLNREQRENVLKQRTYYPVTSLIHFAPKVPDLLTSTAFQRPTKLTSAWGLFYLQPGPTIITSQNGWKKN